MTQETAKERIENEIKSVEKRLHGGRNDGKTYNTGVKEGLMIARAHVIDSSTTDEKMIEKLQEELESCIQTLISVSILANGDENIVIGNFVDSRLSKLAKTHENVTKYIEKVTGKNIDIVLAENAALEEAEGDL
ncbi:hypothetical protein [Lactococcus lactis]|uniref:hypothetical protein n=1 Tax=Lactococcus lactis TaxID=1358 RepID=UPI003569E477